jgi:nucleotide-binding universal stress UspA family protein
MGAELIIVHAYQLPVTMEMPAEVAAVIAKQVQEELDGFIKGIDTQGLKVSSSLCEGVPYVEIVRVAQDTGADLVVIGTHGRTGLAHLLLGSVAERVVRTSTAPVLVIR